MNSDAFPARLKEAIGDTSVRAFSRKADLSEGVVRQYLSAKSEPSRSAVLSMSKTAGVRLEWLVEGTGEKWRDQGGRGNMNANGAVGIIQVGHGSGNKIIQNSVPGDGRSLVSSGPGDDYMSQDLRELVELISKYGSPAIVAEFRHKLLKIKEIIEE